MICGTCHKQMILYEEGSLVPRGRAAVERHLKRCPRCREAFRQEGQLRVVLGPARAVGPRRDLWPAVAARVAARQRQAPARARRAWRPALALGSVVVAVALMVGLASWTQLGHKSKTDIEMAPVSLVYEDPWAGDVARAMDSALSGGA